MNRGERAASCNGGSGSLGGGAGGEPDPWAMLVGWGDVERFLRLGAERDVAGTGEIAPCFVAFTAETPLLVAYLRPFPKGEYADPLIELIALAGPLGADRMAASLAGRAWSLDDPVAPVHVEGDLRQRVLAVHGADGTHEPPRPFGVLWPFEQRGCELHWGEAVRTEQAEGWVPQALSVAVAERHRLVAAPGEVAGQADRCARLGHALYLAPEAQRRLSGSR